MAISEILFIATLVFVIWIWRDDMQAREQAVAASIRACQQINAQFLDQTVVLTKLRLCRTNDGVMALCRLYVFDFSLDGEVRREGVITMKGQRIVDLVLDVDHTTVLH